MSSKDKFLEIISDIDDEHFFKCLIEFVNVVLKHTKKSGF